MAKEGLFLYSAVPLPIASPITVVAINNRCIKGDKAFHILPNLIMIIEPTLIFHLERVFATGVQPLCKLTSNRK